MPKVKNISGGVYKLQGKYVWKPGDTLDVPEDVATHVLDAQAGRFELVADEPTVTEAPTRKQSGGRSR